MVDWYLESTVPNPSFHLMIRGWYREDGSRDFPNLSFPNDSRYLSNPLHGGCKVRKGPKVAKFLDR